MAHEKGVQRLLHGAGIQLQQCSALWFYSLSSCPALRRHRETAIVPIHIQHQDHLDTFELAIELVLHAKHTLVNGVGTNSVIG